MKPWQLVGKRVLRTAPPETGDLDWSLTGDRGKVMVTAGDRFVVTQGTLESHRQFWEGRWADDRWVEFDPQAPSLGAADRPELIQLLALVGKRAHRTAPVRYRVPATREHIAAAARLTECEDRSYMDEAVEILRVTEHHIYIRGRFHIRALNSNFIDGCWQQVSEQTPIVTTPAPRRYNAVLRWLSSLGSVPVEMF